MLNEVPVRGTGTPMPPTDPLIYRFYELVMVNGPAWKALIEEEFGDGIMSAIDFNMEFAREANPKGDPRREGSTMSQPDSCYPTNITAPSKACRNTATRRRKGRSAFGLPQRPANRNYAVREDGRFARGIVMPRLRLPVRSGHQTRKWPRTPARWHAAVSCPPCVSMIDQQIILNRCPSPSLSYYKTL